MFKSTILFIIATLFISQTSAFAPSTKPSTTITHSNLETQRYNIIDSAQSFFGNFGKKVTASHILIGPRTWTSEEDAREQLAQLKAEIGNDPEKFAAAAEQISQCPSAKNGGDLGEFGPAQMVVNFDKVCFNEEVGVVHGPISTQFGEHLILITSRTGEE